MFLWSYDEGVGLEPIPDFDPSGFVTKFTVLELDSVTIPVDTYINATVQWIKEDGTPVGPPVAVTSEVDPALTYTNPSSTEIVTVYCQIIGRLYGVRFDWDANSAASLRGVEQLGAMEWTDFVNAFRGSALEYFKVGPQFSVDADYSFMTLNHMLAECPNLTYCNFDNFAVHADGIEKATHMFYSCASLKVISLSGIQIEGTNNLKFMFAECPELEYVNLTNILIGKTYNMQSMFENCAKLQTVDFTGWENEKFQYGALMFRGCSSLKHLDLSPIDVTELSQCDEMFAGCISLETLNLSGWDLQLITNMRGMFRNCTSLYEINFDGLTNGPHLKDVGEMFQGCSQIEFIKFTHLVGGPIELMDRMFQACTNLKYADFGPTTIGTNVTTMNKMFRFCANLTTVNFNQFQTSNKLTDIGEMFRGCSKLTNIWNIPVDLSGVTNASKVFQDCTSIVAANMELWDMKALDISEMFKGCSNLERVNFGTTPGTWNNIQNMSEMFNLCVKLDTVNNFESLGTGNMTGFDSVFRQCNSLNRVIFSNLQLNSITTGFGELFLACPLRTDDYSTFLRRCDLTTVGLTLHIEAPQSYYDSSAATERANLLARGWTINDLGLEP